MPLARILTRFPEQADALSQELRQHGYTVEFSSPELAGKSPADLEIDFEICAEPDALSRASELADHIQADVAISPGVLIQPAVEKVEQTQFEQVEPAERPDNVLPFINPAQGREPEITQEQQAEPVAHEVDTPESSPVQEQVWEPEPMPPSAEVELPANMPAEPAEPASEPHAPVYSQTNTAFDDEIDLVRAAAPADHEGESATELLARAGEKSATVLHVAGEAGREVWGALRKGAKVFHCHAREWMQRGREQVNLRREEFKMQRDQKAQEQERRRALEQERAAELEAAREAAAVRLQELLRERGGLTEAQPIPPEKPAPPLPLPVASATDSATNKDAAGFFGGRMRIPFSRTYRPQLEAVLMGVAAACCFFVLGLVVASFHARPAISDTIQQPSQPQPGYQGVTAKGGGVTVQGGMPAASLQKSNSAARPGTGAVAQPEEKPSATRAADVTVRNFPSAHRQTSRRSGNSEHIGDDVVIRHFGAPVSGPTHTAPRAELKHYSDLDN